MLGSANEADDAVQEAWLRLARTDTDNVHNMKGWLTTFVARVCLDMLRSRAARREVSLDATLPAESPDPEREATLADSVGLAMLVLLDTLTPAERLAFVLHDMFGLPFDEIGGILGRSPDAAKLQRATRPRCCRRRRRRSTRRPGIHRRTCRRGRHGGRGGQNVAALSISAPPRSLANTSASTSPQAGSATPARCNTS
jgi:RNA polymerase sigma-70 factor (ECF subfamily)